MPPPLVPLLGKAVLPAMTAGMGSIISSGLNMLGGILGKSKPRGPSYQQQWDRDDSRIQRTAADAKAAGLHPLFALGASGATTPSFIAGQAETGSNLGDVLKSASQGVKDYSRATATNPLATKLMTLQVQNAEINVRKNLIDEQLMSSQLSRETQAAGSTGRDIEFPMNPEVRDLRRTPIPKNAKIPIAADNTPIKIRMPGGQHLIVDKSLDAQEMEDLFGDPVSWGYGVWKLAKSVQKTMDEGKKPGYGSEIEKANRRMLKMFGNRWKEIIFSYDRITKGAGFKKMVDSTKSTRQRIVR